MNNQTCSLIDALFPKVRQQVLGLLFARPQESFYTKEIIRITGSGTGAVQRELEKLLASGLISVEISGRQKRYQANHSSVLFNELHSIFVKTSGVADVLTRALEPIANKIELAFIYGSVARQDDTAKSDIDLMLISDDASYAEVFPLLQNCYPQLGREINPTFYSAKEWSSKRNKQNNFIHKVIAEPKIFLIGSNDELEQL